jgi:hypothetical protein
MLLHHEIRGAGRHRELVERHSMHQVLTTWWAKPTWFSSNRLAMKTANISVLDTAIQSWLSQNALPETTHIIDLSSFPPERGC